MQNGKCIVVVLPAYNAERTLERTLAGVPPGIVDQFLLVDDASQDNTAALARSLGDRYPLSVIIHPKNRGYGANQKTCFEAGLNAGADVVVMLHPDYQYEPKLLASLSGLVSSGVYDVALGSRILGNGAIKGGMPCYKYIANRTLTLLQNLAIGQKLSEYHTGYRAYSREVLESVRFQENSDGFVFDNEILVQCHLAGFAIGEISVPTKYFPEASSIDLGPSIVYGLGVLRCSLAGFAGRFRLFPDPSFRPRPGLTINPRTTQVRF